jgi:quercetin 2,3-dioxygenase
MTMEMTKAQARPVARIVPAIRTIEGGGFVVRRPFPTSKLADIDPFLMLDHLGPVHYGPGKAIGAPDHPHRGFETVSYILEGQSEHRDSFGNHGLLNGGDVQWMTAGSGLVHSEMPSAEFIRTGGTVHGFQIWVNLPARAKMTAPRYQDIRSEELPVGLSADGKVRVKVIAGEALGQSAVIATHTPIMFLDYTVQPGGRVEQPVPSDYNVFAYIIEGSGQFGDAGQTVKDSNVVQFGTGGEVVTFGVPDDATAPMRLLLLGGVPLNEPVARYGPFVMNTEAEIIQAIDDYQHGRMGVIKK